MTIIQHREGQLFPQFNAAQLALARRFASDERCYPPGANIYRAGERHVPVFMVVAGELTIYRRRGDAPREKVITLPPGGVSGEVAQLDGRAALAEGEAGPEGCEVLAFDAAHLRALIIGSAEIGEILMRAFILRRAALIADGAASIVAGRPGHPALTHLQGFLSRNGYPYTLLDVTDQGDGQALYQRLGLNEEDLPIVVCPNGSVLKHPSDADVGSCLGITPELDPAHVYDVAVVGAGPAGLATAVYGASEGLSMLVLDTRAFGGQAGASSRIENYLGFPTGISGHALAARAFNQAQKFGARIAIPVTVEALDCGGSGHRPGELFTLRLSDGRQMRARAVVVASGARYRRLPIDNLAMFEGFGVSYWASPVEAKLCEDKEVALIGGGNSAGQAVVYLAPRVRHLHMVIRRDGLEATMSRYLIDRIAALPNVTLHTHTEVTALEGDSQVGLTAATFINHASGVSKTVPLQQLFLFIGADPNTDWLQGCAVRVDAKGFVCTGQPEQGPAWTAAGREPMPLETSVPGIFAIGDVRAGSTKRVAAAVGEGAQVVAALHRILAVTPAAPATPNPPAEEALS